MTARQGQDEFDRKFVDVNFAFAHLPEHLRGISQSHRNMAEEYLDYLPANNQRSAALNYLLLAKDAAVRAKLKGQP